jgi:hypothetical protein
MLTTCGSGMGEAISTPNAPVPLVAINFANFGKPSLSPIALYGFNRAGTRKWPITFGLDRAVGHI